MALFNKKKTQTPAASTSPAPTAPASNPSNDFSDFSLEALDTASVDTSAAGKKGRKAAREKKPLSGRALKAGVAIGLNIGADSIKAVELRVKGSELAITGMGMVPTPAESISNGVVMSVHGLATGIREVLAEAGIKSKRVVTAVSGTGALVVRIIEVPKMSDGELADNMKMDADRYIPFPPSEVIMDFTALRELPADPDAANMEVLLAAAQREVIDLHVQVLQEAKLDPRSIDVEPLAAARILTHPLVTGAPALNGAAAGGNAVIEDEVDYSDVVAILNIGASGTEISILRGDILVFTRTVPTGGNAMTQALVDTLGLAWSDAEQLKREMGDALPPGDLAEESTPIASADAVEELDWTEPPEADAGEGQGNDFTPDPELESSGGDVPTTSAASPDATFTDEMPATDTNAAGDQAGDPFADDFYEQGPGDLNADDVQNVEPGEQHQQKEGEASDSENAVSPFNFGDVDSPEIEGDAQVKELPTYDGSVTGPEDIAGNLSTPEAEEASLLPSLIEKQATDSAPPENPAAAEQAGSTPAATSAAPSSFFDFGYAEESEDKLPTLQEGRPTSFADMLVEEEDDFSSLPTLREGAAPGAPVPSAFEFPDVTAPTTTGDVGVRKLDAQDKGLLPSQEAAPPAANAFSFSFDNTPASVQAQPDIEAGVAPSAIEVDPFAEFMASAGADASAALPSVASASPPTAQSTPVVDNLDLDLLFGGMTGAAENDATQAVANDLGFSGLDTGSDDFGLDDATFGVGLAGASVGEINAQALHQVLDLVLETLVNEVRRSLEYHTTRYPDAAVRRIILVGGGARLKNIDVYFTQKLGLPAVIGNPAARLVLQAPNLPAGYADQNGTLFTVALGLAMRELTR